MTRLKISTSHGTLSVRAEHPDGSDNDFLFRLFAAVKSEEMAAMPAASETRQALLRMQFRSMRTTYAEAYKAARFEVVELDGTPIGRVVTDISAERVLFVDLAILPELQRGGLATALMTALLEEPRRLGICAEATVLVTNAASLRLCSKLGFVETGQEFPFLLLRLPVPEPARIEGRERADNAECRSTLAREGGRGLRRRRSARTGNRTTLPPKGPLS